MLSRQDYIIVVKEKRRDTSYEENSPGDAETARSLRSYVARQFESATRRQPVWSFKELQGEAFCLGGVAGGAVTMTTSHL